MKIVSLNFEFYVPKQQQKHISLLRSPLSWSIMKLIVYDVRMFEPKVA